jgi:hypothetical protein
MGGWSGIRKSSGKAAAQLLVRQGTLAYFSRFPLSIYSMKKVFLSAALALAVAGSWAFYPKATAESGGYMMLTAYSFDGRGTIVTTAPDGKVSIVQIKEADAPLARAKTLLKLNELRRDGWQVVQMTDPNSPQTSNGSYYDNSFNEKYLLEKR